MSNEPRPVISTFSASSLGLGFRARLQMMTKARAGRASFAETAGSVTRNSLDRIGDVIVREGPQIGRALGEQAKRDIEEARSYQEVDPLDRTTQICEAIGSVADEPTDRRGILQAIARGFGAACRNTPFAKITDQTLRLISSF